MLPCVVTIYNYIGVCPPSTFRCSNGNCISPLLTCDGEDNCRDGSDEIADHCNTGIIRCVNRYTLNIKLIIRIIIQIYLLHKMRHVWWTNSDARTKIAFRRQPSVMDLTTVETEVTKIWPAIVIFHNLFEYLRLF